METICCSKSKSKSLSASSKTKNFKFLSEKFFVFWRWSKTLPGVPTIIWGNLLNDIAWLAKSRPPTKTVVLSPRFAPIASRCSLIWILSSLVGARIKAKNGDRLSSSFWIIGIPKAAVFPEPVSAKPITSRSFNAYDNVSFWIFVGFL